MPIYPLTIAPMSISGYGHQYIAGFCSVFEQSVDGQLLTNFEKYNKAETWFNENYLMMSMISGNQLTPVHCTTEATFRHIYSMAYVTLLRVSATYNIPIPSSIQPLNKTHK